MGYKCRKCELACSCKSSRDCLNLYDHNYTNNIVLPDNQNSRYSTWNYIHDIEHSYCGEPSHNAEYNYCVKHSEQNENINEHNYCGVPTNAAAVDTTF